MSDKLDYAIEQAQQRVAQLESDLAEARSGVAFLLKMKKDERHAPVAAKVARPLPPKPAKKRPSVADRLQARTPRERFKLPRAQHGVKFFPKTFARMSPPDAVREYFRHVKVPVRGVQIAEELMAHGFESKAEKPATIVRLVLKRLEAEGELDELNKQWQTRSYWTQK